MGGMMPCWYFVCLENFKVREDLGDLSEDARIILK
jgi:hypothetical protein